MNLEALNADLPISPRGFLTGPSAPSQYWGEIDKDEFLQLCSRVADRGAFHSVVTDFFEHHKRRDLYAYITDLAGRCSWHTLLRPGRRKVAVDVGAGLGAISEYLAGCYDQVYSIEGCRERCEFLQLRKNLNGLDRQTIIHSSVHQIPIKDGAADLVVCNGVLEWVALEKPGSVREVQLNFLKELRRILAPEGILYIGIENRIARNYFRGSHDHSGKRYTSLMPRWLASLVCRDWKANPLFSAKSEHGAYRTYTYSAWGYRSLLKEAGFQHTSVYVAEPSYDIPRYSFPINGNTNDTETFIRTFCNRKFNQFRERYLSSNFYIFSSGLDLTDRVEVQPTLFGYFDTLQLKDQKVERTSLAGGTKIEPIEPGVPALSKAESRLSTVAVCDGYLRFMKSVNAVQPDPDHALIHHAMDQCVANLVRTDVLATLKQQIESNSTNRYHGDYWIGNMNETTDVNQAVLFDPETQLFGWPELDAMDFLIDFRLFNRSKQFPGIILTELGHRLGVNIHDRGLLLIALLRQVLRYSPFHRSQAAFYDYRNLLVKCAGGEPLLEFAAASLEGAKFTSA